jgi:phage tail sheath gpL-like
MVSQNIGVPGISFASPPGVYDWVTFANGGSGAGSGQYFPLILGNMIQDGYSAAFADFVPGQVFGPNVAQASLNLQTVQQAINFFGAGSGLALMYAQLRAINPTVPIFVAPVAAAVGTQASQSVTIVALANGSVSNGQVSGLVQYQVDGKVPAQALINSTDSQNTIAANLAAAINNNVNLPVTAVAASNVVTVTAKVPGQRSNDLRGFALIASGSGVTLSGAVNSPSNFTGGAGSDLAGYTATLNALETQGIRYYYLVCEAGCDLNDGFINDIPVEIQSFLTVEAEPSQGNRERAILGSNSTVANSAAQTALLNFERMEVHQMNQLDLTPGEMAAIAAGWITFIEAVPLTAGDVNFDSLPLPGVSAPLNGSAPSKSDISSAILSGITPWQVGPGNSVNMVKRVTTRFFTLGGPGGDQEVLDLRIADAGVVSIVDRFTDDLSSVIALNCQRQMIGQDTSSGAPPVGPGITTPNKVRQLCINLITQYGSAGLVNAPASIAGLQVQQNPPPNDSSIGIVIPLYVNSLLHQVLINVQQTVSSV